MNKRGLIFPHSILFSLSSSSSLTSSIFHSDLERSIIIFMDSPQPHPFSRIFEFFLFFWRQQCENNGCLYEPQLPFFVVTQSIEGTTKKGGFCFLCCFWGSRKARALIRPFLTHLRLCFQGGGGRSHLKRIPPKRRRTKAELVRETGGALKRYCSSVLGKHCGGAFATFQRGGGSGLAAIGSSFAIWILKLFPPSSSSLFAKPRQAGIILYDQNSASLTEATLCLFFLPPSPPLSVFSHKLSL